MKIFKYNIIICLLWFLTSWGNIIYAHPPVSIVMDRTGNIFYSDLFNVWVIRPDGAKEIAVANVHTHELWLSPDGVLYGEDVKNQGEHYRHRVWSLSPDRKLSDVIPWREGHPTEYSDYSFVRDNSGLSYVLLRGDKRIDVYRQGNRVRSISLNKYKGYIHWHIIDNGVIWVAIGGSLIRIKGNSSSVIASNLIERTKAFDFVHDRHALMGMWTDTNGNIYVSVYSGQVVKRVNAQGVVKTVFSSKGSSYSVAGGTFNSEGAMLLLEYSSSNQVRIRKVWPDGKEEIL